MNNPLTKALFGFIGMLLCAASLLLCRNAVQRADYLHVALVFLAFLPFAVGGFLLAFAVGVFPAP
jgi:hypothetical protein